MHPIHLLALRHTPAIGSRWWGALCYGATLALLSPRNPLRHRLPGWLTRQVVGQGWAWAREAG